jgi:hypothetical protein
MILLFTSPGNTEEQNRMVKCNRSRKPVYALRLAFCQFKMKVLDIFVLLQAFCDYFYICRFNHKNGKCGQTKNFADLG